MARAIEYGFIAAAMGLALVTVMPTLSEAILYEGGAGMPPIVEVKSVEGKVAGQRCLVITKGGERDDVILMKGKGDWFEIVPPGEYEEKCNPR
jgi:hypothetical protein